MKQARIQVLSDELTTRIKDTEARRDAVKAEIEDIETELSRKKAALKDIYEELRQLRMEKTEAGALHVECWATRKNSRGEDMYCHKEVQLHTHIHRSGVHTWIDDSVWSNMGRIRSLLGNL